MVEMCGRVRISTISWLTHGCREEGESVGKVDGCVRTGEKV